MGLESSLRAVDVMRTYSKNPKLIEGICQDESNQMFLNCKDDFAKIWNEKRWKLETV